MQVKIGFLKTCEGLKGSVFIGVWAFLRGVKCISWNGLFKLAHSDRRSNSAGTASSLEVPVHSLWKLSDYIFNATNFITLKWTYDVLSHPLESALILRLLPLLNIGGVPCFKLTVEVLFSDEVLSLFFVVFPWYIEIGIKICSLSIRISTNFKTLLYQFFYISTDYSVYWERKIITRYLSLSC